MANNYIRARWRLGAVETNANFVVSKDNSADGGTFITFAQKISILIALVPV